MCDYGWNGSGGPIACYGCWHRLPAREEGGRIIHHGYVIRQGVRDIECSKPDIYRRNQAAAR